MKEIFEFQKLANLSEKIFPFEILELFLHESSLRLRFVKAYILVKNKSVLRHELLRVNGGVLNEPMLFYVTVFNHSRLTVKMSTQRNTPSLPYPPLLQQRRT